MAYVVVMEVVVKRNMCYMKNHLEEVHFMIYVGITIELKYMKRYLKQIIEAKSYTRTREITPRHACVVFPVLKID